MSHALYYLTLMPLPADFQLEVINFLIAAIDMGKDLERTRLEIVSENEFEYLSFFEFLDIHNRFRLSRNEIYDFLKGMAPSITEREVDHIFYSIDRNGDGWISLEEFRQFTLPLDPSFNLTGSNRRFQHPIPGPPTEHTQAKIATLLVQEAEVHRDLEIRRTSLYTSPSFSMREVYTFVNNVAHAVHIQPLFVQLLLNDHERLTGRHFSLEDVSYILFRVDRDNAGSFNYEKIANLFLPSYALQSERILPTSPSFLASRTSPLRGSINNFTGQFNNNATTVTTLDNVNGLTTIRVSSPSRNHHHHIGTTTTTFNPTNNHNNSINIVDNLDNHISVTTLESPTRPARRGIPGAPFTSTKVITTSSPSYRKTGSFGLSNTATTTTNIVNNNNNMATYTSIGGNNNSFNIESGDSITRERVTVLDNGLTTTIRVESPSRPSYSNRVRTVKSPTATANITTSFASPNRGRTFTGNTNITATHLNGHTSIHLSSSPSRNIPLTSTVIPHAASAETRAPPSHHAREPSPSRNLVFESFNREDRATLRAMSPRAVSPTQRANASMFVTHSTLSPKPVDLAPIPTDVSMTNNGLYGNTIVNVVNSAGNFFSPSRTTVRVSSPSRGGFVSTSTANKYFSDHTSPSSANRFKSSGLFQPSIVVNNNSGGSNIHSRVNVTTRQNLFGEDVVEVNSGDVHARLTSSPGRSRINVNL